MGSLWDTAEANSTEEAELVDRRFEAVGEVDEGDIALLLVWVRTRVSWDPLDPRCPACSDMEREVNEGVRMEEEEPFSSEGFRERLLRNGEDTHTVLRTTDGGCRLGKSRLAGGGGGGGSGGGAKKSSAEINLQVKEQERCKDG